MNRIAPLALALIVVLLGSCGEDPTSPVDSNSVTIGDGGEQLLGRIPLGDGVIEVRSRDLAWDPDQQVAAFDVYLINKSSMPLEGPADLVVSDLRPAVVAFTNPDGYTHEGLPYREYAAEFGGDGVLWPDEVSDPKTFEFSVGEYRAFAVVFEIEPVAGGVISGIVFRDDDEDGVQGEWEPGVAGVSVVVTSIDANIDPVRYEAFTSEDGMYQVVNLRADVYGVHVEIPEAGAATTPTEITVTLLQEDDGSVSRYADAHFGILVDDAPQELVIEYDFDDGQVPNWEGNARMINRAGVLEIVAQGDQWVYHTFDTRIPGGYTSGTYEFDAKFSPEVCMFDLKGHAEQDFDPWQFGPRVHFREGEVRPYAGGFVDTGVSYDPGLWYRVRCEFDNSLGDRGRYSLFLTRLVTGAETVAVGEFDYDAPGGRFADIVAFGFLGNTLNQVYSTSFFIDNLRLEVR